MSLRGWTPTPQDNNPRPRRPSSGSSYGYVSRRARQNSRENTGKPMDPRESIKLALDSDKYIINITRPCPKSELSSFEKPLPLTFQGFRHNLSPRPRTSVSPRATSRNAKPSEAVTSLKTDKQRPVTAANVSKSSPKQKEKMSIEQFRNQSDQLAMLALKKQLITASNINRKHGETIKIQQKKIEELQRNLMIERQQNHELAEMLNNKAETDALADQYLQALLLGRYQNSVASFRFRRD